MEEVIIHLSDGRDIRPSECFGAIKIEYDSEYTEDKKFDFLLWLKDGTGVLCSYDDVIKVATAVAMSPIPAYSLN